ncbi:two-component system sensor histidine kinase NtrB [Paenibacillus kandeliae]|uniref:two-component system sensor histidine kinase NtrB n=1 Tax=Paenibacillus kandeliae TaxID=3231269 RepID=UPI00345AD403
MLAVGASVFVFSAVVERSGDDSLHPGRLVWRGYAPVLVISFALSIVVGWLLAAYSAIDSRIPLSVVSFIVGVLYIGAWRGLWLLLLSIFMYILFSDNVNIKDGIIQTGILLYPVAGLCYPVFHRSSIRRKRLIVMALILLSTLLTLIVIALHVSLFQLGTGVWLLILFIVVAAIVAGDYCTTAIEQIIEKKQLSRQMLDLSNRVITEAEKLRQIMNVAPMMVTSIDAEGRVTAINEAAFTLLASTLTGLKRDRMNEVSFFDLENGDIREGLKSTIRLIRRVQQSRVNESEIFRLEYGVFYVNVAPLFRNPEEELSGFVIVGQDVTEMEQLRNELSHVEQLSLVGKMAASITHEIRNPMAVVRGFLQLMHEKSPSSLDHYYMIVMDELDRANSIINDFLSLAQNRIVEKEPSSLHAIIEELLPLLWADANLRGQTITFVPGRDIPLLELNSKEIKQLILNLARNGMEAMEDKGELTIETEMTSAEVIMHIRDTGPGIPPDKMDKLFEPFYTTKTKGTGLGLSLCLSIVERHNGRITVDSSEGNGTTFSVIFMRKPEELTAAESVGAPSLP